MGTPMNYVPVRRSSIGGGFFACVQRCRRKNYGRIQFSGKALSQ